ncbi:MAG TPA: AMP-binding protein [Gammaproteobacteria bacterium]|nr:AMP-binding protein [Gammaproteobacteria bacterium]
MNVANLMVRAGRCFAKRPAVAQGCRVLADYQHLAARVASLAGALRQLGLESGDRVAIVMKNAPSYLEVMFAAWHAGLVVVPVNAKLSPREIEYILANSGARLCFTGAALGELVRPLRDSLPALQGVIDVDSADYQRLLAAAPIHMIDREPSDPAWLFYTSGTTGRPKGAVLTHRNLAGMVAGYFISVDAIGPGESILHAAPMSHGSGLYTLPFVAAGGVHVVPDSGGFDADEVFELLGCHERMTLFAAPTMVRRMTEAAVRTRPDTRNLKTIVYGGGPMYLDDLRRAMATFGNCLVEIYGQGESPMTITAKSKALHAAFDAPANEHRLTSVGLPQPLVEVRVAGPDGEPLPPGELGEICVRGDTVMSGYWNNPQATAETIVDGWLHTGDVGCFDEAGFLYLKDRSKDVIISGGTNIYPREVEEVLLEHPAVAEVAVIGEKDADWGEVVVAFVKCEEGCSVIAEELDAFCVERIARFKRPKRYRFLPDLPKNAYGKILKKELREQAGTDSA